MPNDKPVTTVVVSFGPGGGKTRYNVAVRHWTEADKQQHEQMGFEAGWGQCADQLTALAEGR